jgi:hypothetical protein
MRAKFVTFGAAVAGAMMLASVPAAAAVVTQSYLVTANFIQQTAPVKSLTLGFTLTFDPLMSAGDTAVSNYTTSSAAAQFNSLPITFSTTYYAGFGTYVLLGGAPGGSQYLEGSDDFFVNFLVDAQGAPAAGRAANVEYSFTGFRATYNTPLAVIVLNNVVDPGPGPGPGPGGVPEPATWAMLLIGFGAIGAATRQRRQRAVAA